MLIEPPFVFEIGWTNLIVILKDIVKEGEHDVIVGRSQGSHYKNQSYFSLLM